MARFTSHSPLYLASANSGKLREFRRAAARYGIAVECIPSFRKLPPCIEDGASFLENARKKALHYSAFTRGLVFADDSGICVDAIGGAPGIYSARFAGPGATDSVNNAELIRELAGIPGPRRTAHYICVIALAQRRHVLASFKGRAEGMILSAPRGSGGFGYDPYFFSPPLGKTFAELTPEEKFGVSHRGEAFRRLLDFLTAYHQSIWVGPHQAP